MSTSPYRAIETYLVEHYEDGDIAINDGDCDLVAMSIADAVEGMTDPGEIREAVRRSCDEQADAGMLGHPGIHPDIADIVLQRLGKSEAEL